MAFEINNSVVISDQRTGIFAGTDVVNGGYLHIAPPFPGTVSGYTSGGIVGIPGRSALEPEYLNTIDKFPFASDANATDVGDLINGVDRSTGQSSDIFGYSSGGIGAIIPRFNIVQKFPFATNANATDVGDLTLARAHSSGQSSIMFGYNSAGAGPSGDTNVIDKFPFATDSNATDVGDLVRVKQGTAGQSSTVFGYTSGGSQIPPISPFGPSGIIIEKFPFASDTNSTDVGNLTQSRTALSGQSSDTSGYNSGGLSTINTIDKFPFATDANATDVGDLVQGRLGPAGQSSTVFGYVSGGGYSSTNQNNIIEKFPFASDTNATDVADLTQGRIYSSGQQV